jgi:hypothetical protein
MEGSNFKNSASPILVLDRFGELRPVERTAVSKKLAVIEKTKKQLQEPLQDPRTQAGHEDSLNGHQLNAFMIRERYLSVAIHANQVLNANY